MQRDELVLLRTGSGTREDRCDMQALSQSSTEEGKLQNPTVAASTESRLQVESDHGLSVDLLLVIRK